MRVSMTWGLLSNSVCLRESFVKMYESISDLHEKKGKLDCLLSDRISEARSGCDVASCACCLDYLEKKREGVNNSGVPNFSVSSSSSSSSSLAYKKGAGCAVSQL